MDAALQVWLCVLSVVEGVTIYRTAVGEQLPAVFPLFATRKDSSFLLLFQVLAAILAIIRLSVALRPVSVPAWRTCGMVHVVEAVYYFIVCFEMERTLPKTLAAFDVARHGPAAALFAAIVFNALLFSGVYLHKDSLERAYYAAKASARDEAQRKGRIAAAPPHSATKTE